MLRGIYLSAAGMSSQKKYLDVISNNVANANTPGFRSKRVSVSSFGEEIVQRLVAGRGTPVGTVDNGPAVQNAILTSAAGSVISTGRTLDVALAQDSVFLGVQTPGGVAYSRGGSLAVSADGQLVDTNGNGILGRNGPIQLSDTELTGPVTITAKGEVVAGDAVVDELALYNLQADTAEWTPGGLVKGTAEPVATRDDGIVIQGAIEQSNVDVVRELNELIRASRLYQVNQSVLKVHDEALRTALARVGGLS